jgi:hypothetical protein
MQATAPRVAIGAGSMERAAAGIVDRYADAYAGPALRIYDSIPIRHGVIAAEYDATIIRKGEVAVYDELALSEDGLVEGAIYVTESQSPMAGMPWDMWWNTEGQRSRLAVTRSIVVAKRHKGETWATHPLRSRQRGCFIMSDWPLPEHYLLGKIVGRVVGIYNPAALAGGVQ